MPEARPEETPDLMEALRASLEAHVPKRKTPTRRKPSGSGRRATSVEPPSFDHPRDAPAELARLPVAPSVGWPATSRRRRSVHASPVTCSRRAGRPDNRRPVRRSQRRLSQRKLAINETPMKIRPVNSHLPPPGE